MILPISEHWMWKSKRKAAYLFKVTSCLRFTTNLTGFNRKKWSFFHSAWSVIFDFFFLAPLICECFRDLKLWWKLDTFSCHLLMVIIVSETGGIYEICLKNLWKRKENIKLQNRITRQLKIVFIYCKLWILASVKFCKKKRKISENFSMRPDILHTIVPLHLKCVRNDAKFFILHPAVLSNIETMRIKPGFHYTKQV